MITKHPFSSEAQAMEIKLEPVLGGKLDYYRFLKGSGFLFDLKCHLLMRAMGLKYRGVRSSTLRYVEQGRKTEGDFLNGYIAEQGKLEGVDAPLTAAAIDMVKQIEAGERKISRDNLDGPVFKDI